MKHALNILGEAMDEAWRERWPLVKIVVPTSSIIMILQYFLYFKWADPFGRMIGASVANSWLFIYLALAIFGLYITACLWVNALKYIVNRSYEPSWVPFRLSWRAGLGVFGYWLLIALIWVAATIAVTLVVLLLIVMFEAMGFAELNMYTPPTIAQRLAISVAVIFGVLIFVAFILLMIWSFRASLVTVSRALDDGRGLRDVLKATKSKRNVFFWLGLSWTAIVFVLVFAAYMIGALSMGLPVAILFFLPLEWMVVVGLIVFLLVLAVMRFFMMFINFTVYAELYRQYVKDAPASAKSQSSEGE